MEVLSCSSPLNLKMLSLNSYFISQFPVKASKKRNHFRNHNNNNNKNKNSAFHNYLPFSTKRSFVVLSHFGQKTNRRNSLRKKTVIQDHKNQVRRAPSPSDVQHSGPSLDVRDTKLVDSIDGVEEFDSSSMVSTSKPFGGSVMFTKLESWVDQYKKDTEFWGIGSEPIFSVFESSDGNVQRVSVDKEEILRRSQVESSAEANSMVLKAENLAKQMESGNRNVIPRNSSVAKFVVSGEESRFWDAFRGFSLSPNAVKEFPRVGIMLLYGFVAVWALRKLFDFRANEVKLTESEKEMMRRKIKLRKESEALKEDYIEVVRDPLKPIVFSGEKPKLDKQELMKNIARENGNLVALPDSLIHEAAKSSEIDFKIDEIRKMAREAREIETIKTGSIKSDQVENGSSEEELGGFLTHLVNGERSSNDVSGYVLDESFGGNGNANSHEKGSDHNTNHSVTYLIDDDHDGIGSNDDADVRAKPRIIRSVKEARKYLSEKSHKQEGKEEIQFEAVSETDEQVNDLKQHEFATSASEDSVALQIDESNHESDSDDSDTEIWNENNVNEQIVKKIGVGFRDSYLAARENKNRAGHTISSLEELRSAVDNNELDWMEDDRLAEIVFQVRENELAGLDPFHKMDAKDKDAFFKGLEKKVERENEKLSVVHEFLHSSIENLDYGADGISVYDPLEKIIPRWKGPVLEKSPEFLNNFQEQRKAIFAENIDRRNNDQIPLQKSTESQPGEKSGVSDPKKKLRRSQASSKTVIESSDGSVKPGKKSGKEFWQHTKKWSRGFLESYNAETDPEVKSTMGDIGKDLDRWITEKEIQEAADLMDKLPKQSKKFMENKLGKLKREMELFGPQAVVSKYREYSNDDQEDYLWWLDLPHILCIELYTEEEGEQRIGFYSLEMATDLELEPKPHHVIAFEDAGDCKNVCYIIQAQMEILGNGHAFVVAQPPKDAFREAKENGFNVSVIRKGELKLNVDQALEEVEEQISEIGSKMYHDMIMRDRSVDISSLMKGVFGFKSRPTTAKRKRSKKIQKKRGKK